MSETVASVVAVKRAVEKQDAFRQRMREVVLRRVEDALAVRAEAAERYTKRITQVVGRWLGVLLGRVGRQRRTFRPVDRDLRPLLRVAPS